MITLYYDHFLKLMDESKFECGYTDTDSLMIAYANPDISKCLKKNVTEAQFQDSLNQYFVVKKCQKTEYGRLKVETDNIEAAYIPAPKLYYLRLPNKDRKISAKGIQLRNNSEILTEKAFSNMVENQSAVHCTNRGIKHLRMSATSTYIQRRTLVPVFTKRGHTYIVLILSQFITCFFKFSIAP